MLTVRNPPRRPLLWSVLALALCGGALAQVMPALDPAVPAAKVVPPMRPPGTQATPELDAIAGTVTSPVHAGPPVPLLWRVYDADNDVYLLGSFHLLKPGDYPLSRDVELAFADAEALVFELAPEEMASPQLAIQMGQAAVRADGNTLSAALPPGLARKLDTWLADNATALAGQGIQPQMLQMFEPWFVALTVTLSNMAGQGLDPKLGLDAHMAGRAAQARKPTSGLETGAQQIALLDGMDAAEQLQFLDESLDGALDGGGEVQALHAAWRAGDADAMWSGMAVEMRTRYPALYRRINVERNDAWVPSIEAMLSRPGTDDALVVVGSLHLLGEDGVVEKLRARGYAVERVCSACTARTVPATR